ncbi:hypothetical protein SAMN02799643_05662 [Methylobacterium sp. UNCCL125]|nr:hypothetical protein SAMN02799643_05662 [Methylobacterium sp. UNCCL125]
MPEESLAFAGRAYAPGAPVEQPTSDLQFEVAHALRNCGLTDVQLLGCTGETPALSHSRKQP